MEDMNNTDELAVVLISSKVSDLEKAKKDANDLAWEHAKDYAKMVGLSIGSEEFETLFRQLSVKYEENTDYLQYFLTTAMLTVRELLESKNLALPHGEGQDTLTENEILELISGAARVLVASYIWIAGGQAIGWPKNDEIDGDVNIPFFFDKTDIIIDNEEV